MKEVLNRVFSFIMRVVVSGKREVFQDFMVLQPLRK